MKSNEFQMIRKYLKPQSSISVTFSAALTELMMTIWKSMNKIAQECRFESENERGNSNFMSSVIRPKFAHLAVVCWSNEIEKESVIFQFHAVIFFLHKKCTKRFWVKSWKMSPIDWLAGHRREPENSLHQLNCSHADIIGNAFIVLIFEWLR